MKICADEHISPKIVQAINVLEIPSGLEFTHVKFLGCLKAHQMKPGFGDLLKIPAMRLLLRIE